MFALLKFTFDYCMIPKSKQKVVLLAIGIETPDAFQYRTWLSPPGRVRRQTDYETGIHNYVLFMFYKTDIHMLRNTSSSS